VGTRQAPGITTAGGRTTEQGMGRDGGGARGPVASDDGRLGEARDHDGGGARWRRR
jgi:hypothetical protein